MRNQKLYNITYNIGRFTGLVVLMSFGILATGTIEPTTLWWTVVVSLLAISVTNLIASFIIAVIGSGSNE